MYEFFPTDMPPSPVDVLEDYPPGLFHEGYGLEIQGYPHHRQMDKQAMVFLPQGTKFRIRLCNANEYMAMASVFIDGISIGQCIPLSDLLHVSFSIA